MSSEAAYFPDALTTSPEACSTAASTPEDPANAQSETSERPFRIADQTIEAADNNLIEQVCKGSRDALALLFRKHNRAVRNVAYRILRDEPEADDLVQEVFLFLFQKSALFDPCKGSASSWIIQIAYHRAMNRRQYLAHRQHYNAQELDEEKIGVGRQPLLIDELTARNLLNRLREQLSQEQTVTLELHFFEGYSLREIAEKTKQPLGNVRHHFYRGIERLRSNVFPKKNT